MPAPSSPAAGRAHGVSGGEAVGPASAEEAATPRVLAGLRVALHVAFAGLLGLGLMRALGPVAASGVTGAPDALGAARTGPFTATLLVCLSGALAAVYLIGTVVERRRWHQGRGVGRAAALGWLALVLALWSLLVAHHADFAWVAFPLFFVALHVVALTAASALARRVLGPLLVVVMAGVVVLGTAVGEGEGHGAGALTLRPAAVIGPLVGAAVAVVLYGAYRALHLESVRQRAIAEQLRAAQAELARTERRAGVAAERERLAREIHDTLTQGLASIVLISRAAQDALDADDPVLAHERLETVRLTAAENLDESRAFVRGVHRAEQDGQERDGARPPGTRRDGAEGGQTAERQGRDGQGVDRPATPTGGGLVTALKAAVAGFVRRQRAAGTPVHADVEVVGEPAPVAEAAVQAVLRAVQSSLANVAAHAHADRARVTVSFLPGELAVDVADDGVGFSLETVRGGAGDGAAGTGVGLRGVHERMDAIGGRAEVETAPGQGTVVVLRVPMPGGPAVAADAHEQDREGPSECERIGQDRR